MPDQLALFRGHRPARTPCLAAPLRGGRWGSRKPRPTLLSRRQQIVLAIDPGAASGHSLWWCGQLVDSGTCAPARAGPVVRRALQMARAADLRLVAVSERPYSHGRAAESLCASWGAWAAELQKAGHCMRHVVRVHPSTWQSATLRGHGLSQPGEAKRRAWLRAAALLGHPPDTQDQADSICLGLWSTQGATR